MNAKKIVRYLLLIVVCVGLGLVGYQQFGTISTVNTDNVNIATSVSPQLKNGLNVYYFHGNQRCTTCIRMEKFTQTTMITQFFKQVRNGEMQLNLVNVDLPENQHYIDDYQLVFRTVVIANTRNGVDTDWRRLDRVWELANNEQAFSQYLTEEINAMVNQTKANQAIVVPSAKVPTHG
ncbi:nitrophenyl compound nitroreductase subunit ArsF family protein [Shewanella algae]|uniref:nitrophenyl compound nitroreductase subunit ArsF family protein n=1 Tax=Shewanella algae TaxID=38313 RepID=UPI001AACBB90|nr:nitrophenyl compound nitroreductase subunit ArsF family protein [Shewanella algae]MBO2687325.1 hypothetical protein [Shewanella algae]MDC8855824.1 nitrophenyl compound nitroreductase subunit ArsF family protein [Shewanella algae]